MLFGYFFSFPYIIEVLKVNLNIKRLDFKRDIASFYLVVGKYMKHQSNLFNKNSCLSKDFKPIELDKPNLKLDPYFITGLIEAEGSFSITKHKDKRSRHDITIGLRFKITMLVNETQLLYMVKSFFNCGNIFTGKDGTITFEIRDIDSINKYVVSHFINYPLRGTKYLDFLSFKKSLSIINLKDHLTKDGINEIIGISNNMNSYRVHGELYAPSHTIIGNSDYIPINGHYINGFIAGDGCLALNTKDIGFGRMSLQISQHKNNKILIFSIANYFKSPNKVYYHGTNSVQLTLSGIKL